MSNMFEHKVYTDGCASQTSTADSGSKEEYRLTPKGIAVIAMLQTGLVSDMDDPRIDGFWTIFKASMKGHGYIEEYE